MHVSIERFVNVTLTVLFALLFMLSITASWYRYVVQENFRYFLTEDEVPDRFDLSSY